MFITSRILIRGLKRLNLRYASDWNAMSEAFSEPVLPKSIKRNQSSSSSPPAPAPALEKAADTLKEPMTISKSFGSISLNDFPSSLLQQSDQSQINWSDSFHGLGAVSFDDKIQKILAEPIGEDDIEITPDGLLYLPEIKYRRVLNKSFGAGGWGLAPRSETVINKNGLGGTLTREYALICQGRLVGIARGEQDFFSDKGIPTASEGCKSNALMRCCKDLGIASELWDPKFIRVFKKKNCEELFVEHVVNKRKKKIWKRKDGFVEYPFKKT